MNLKYFLLVIVSLSCFFSCGKNHNPGPQNLIAGNWNLQQQHVLFEQDSVKLADTMLSATATTYGTVVFNSDGTFSSSATYFSGSTSLNTGLPPSQANSAGKYSYTNNVFTVSPGLAGWYAFAIGATGQATNTTQTIQITQLTDTKLTVHAENKFTLPTSTGAHAFDEVSDYYYSK